MLRFPIALVSTCLTCMPLLAQYTTAALGGNVVDNTGGAIPEAKVTVRNAATGFTLTTVADATGAFLFSRLSVGTYELKVEKEGFTTYVQSGITLTVNQVANQTVSLQIGQISERITVEANADVVVTRTATGGQLIDQKRVVDLPLNGRGAQTLIFLAAGTIDLTSRYCGVGCQGGVYPGEQTAGVNGVGYGQVNYQLDGTDHNDSYVNMNLPFPNPDSIQEFNLQSSLFTAEYGNAAGGVVNIVTKSGTNDIHGDAFEFLRNGSLNARISLRPPTTASSGTSSAAASEALSARTSCFISAPIREHRCAAPLPGALPLCPPRRSARVISRALRNSSSTRYPSSRFRATRSRPAA